MDVLYCWVVRHVSMVYIGWVPSLSYSTVAIPGTQLIQNKTWNTALFPRPGSSSACTFTH